MTNDVTADDIAAALREAVNAHTSRSDFVVDSQYHKERMARWQSILDRYDAQRRATISALGRAKSFYMSQARQESGDDRLWRVEQAREANWEIVRLRRQLRALGGDV